MSTAETKALIEAAVAKFQSQVPALQKLKLVIELGVTRSAATSSSSESSCPVRR
jgi:hypothetical protein